MSLPGRKNLPFSNSKSVLPYGRQTIDDDDIAAVAKVLRSDWLTTGPIVPRFEEAVAAFTGARYGVAVSSGTAALHAALYAIGIGPGDEVIVPPVTFVATANAVVFQGGTPVFADVDPETLLLDPAAAEAAITPRTKAIIAVDYAGQPCDYTALRAIADRHNLALIADACHSLGARHRGEPVGTHADLTVFSFHPVKNITTGEGGMILTGSLEYRNRMAAFRNHGIDTDHRQRAERGSWFYEMQDLGYNYRITDFQCALGSSQLAKLPGWLARRAAIADRYTRTFEQSGWVRPLAVRSDVTHAWHLYIVRLDRTAAFDRLREQGIAVNVHYIPVHLQPYYRRHWGTGPGLCPVAEAAYPELLTLPLFPAMTDEDTDRVIRAICELEMRQPNDEHACNRYR
jgi:UDP-4-amino-4,6-dideoxy-N-acetyl-beta-L-altrosamine transaminase